MNFLTDNKRLLNDTDDLTPDSIQFLREQIADETLRKAAPDLLEALELARNEINILLVNAGVVFPDQQETLWRINAAIAKARGQ